MVRAVCLLLLTLLAAPVPSPAQGPLGSAADAYRFGAEDIIAIQVWGRDELTGSVTVDYNGRIQIPLLGEVVAAGRTPADLREDLTERFQLIDPTIPEVLVSVEEYVSRSVSVIGAVNSPGVYGFRDMPGIWDALLEAGGPRSDAELSLVQVVRARGADGASETIPVDLSMGIQNAREEDLPVLRPKDRIVVPEAEDTPISGDRYHVLGAVRAPGVYRLNTAHNVVEALSVSGGPLATAQLNGVFLTRTTEFGIVSYRLDLEGHLQRAVPLANLGLLPGDTIMVPERSSFFKSFSESVGRLIPLFSIIITGYIAATR